MGPLEPWVHRYVKASPTASIGPSGAMSATLPPRQSQAQLPEAAFEFFWRDYLDAHRHPLTRALHYLATIMGVGSVILSLVLLNPVLPLIGIPISYALALGSHRWVEGKPSMMRINAVYGARADLRMCRLALFGQIADEYAHLGLGQPFPKSGRTRTRALDSGL